MFFVVGFFGVFFLLGGGIERAERKMGTGPVTHVDPLTMIRKRGPRRGRKIE